MDRTNDRTNHSGLALIGVLLHKTKLGNQINAIFLSDHLHPEISHGTIAKSMIELLGLGKPYFETIESFQEWLLSFINLN